MKTLVGRLEPDVPHQSTGLVLLGEQGTDPHLRRALQHVQAEQTIVFASGQDDYSVADPMFAAAQGIGAAS